MADVRCTKDQVAPLRKCSQSLGVAVALILTIPYAWSAEQAPAAPPPGPAEVEQVAEPEAEIVEMDSQLEEPEFEALQPAAAESQSAATEPLENEMPVLLGVEETPEDLYQRLERQVELQEYEPTLDEVAELIDGIERDSHRYDLQLAKPLMIRGDIRFALEDFPGALDDYSRAVHVQRVNAGLHHPDQIQAVYREASALKSIGQIDEANRREEYAYSILRKHYGSYSPDILPGLYHLADWHRRTSNVFGARRLYGQAVLIVESTEDELSPNLIKPLEGLAYTYRIERFPPFYSAQSSSSSLASSGRPDLYEGSRPLTLNNFPAGEKALTRIVRIREVNKDAEPVKLAEAIIDLADWNLLFEKYRLAEQLYQHALLLLTEAHEQASAAIFANPELLHFPQPQNPKRPDSRLNPERKTGHVTLSYDVTDRGTVTNLETLESQPEGLMDFRVRKSMRAARFRPPLIEGQLIAVADQTYRHEFSYFPSQNESAPTQSKSGRKEAESDTAMLAPADD
ncbi:MAG: TonB family protein [Pseudomonadales bacterium]